MKQQIMVICTIKINWSYGKKYHQFSPFYQGDFFAMGEYPIIDEPGPTYKIGTLWTTSLVPTVVFICLFIWKWEILRPQHAVCLELDFLSVNIETALVAPLNGRLWPCHGSITLTLGGHWPHINNDYKPLNTTRIAVHTNLLWDYRKCFLKHSLGINLPPFSSSFTVVWSDYKFYIQMLFFFYPHFCIKFKTSVYRRHLL